MIEREGGGVREGERVKSILFVERGRERERDVGEESGCLTHTL